MRKINLDKKFFSIKGKPLTKDEPTPGVSDRILIKMKKYMVSTPDLLVEEFNKWQEDLKKTEKKDMTLRDYLLIILGARFTMKDKKESFWTTQLGILISDDKNKELKISDSQFAFLKRIMENNKIKQPSPMGGEVEIEVFFPYELGQILEVFEDEETPKPAEPIKSDEKK